jgi:hypothetical protein
MTHHVERTLEPQELLHGPGSMVGLLRFTVVSKPARINRNAIASSSVAVNRSPSWDAVTNAESTSSPGSGRYSAVSWVR